MPFSLARSDCRSAGLSPCRIERLEARQLLSSGPLLDGGFESPVVAIGGFATFATGQKIGSAWTVLGPAGDQVPVDLLQTTYAEPANGVTFKAEEGLNAADLTGNANQGTTCGVQQIIPTVAGKVYQVSFFVGRGRQQPLCHSRNRGPQHQRRRCNQVH